jgi:hypothetical protein
VHRASVQHRRRRQRERRLHGEIPEARRHVICYNLIENHWDNISLYTIDEQKKPGGFPCVSVDIYGNDFFGGRDDGVEADYQNHNIRIFRNRFTNTGSTISFQPLYGGPGYVLYNEIYNGRIKPYKFHVVVLPNINDGYIGAAPDLGCHEFGQPAPHYGPRTAPARRPAGN